MRDRIQLDPEYQRVSDIWTPDKRQLLIDTILNDFDIPKLYLHKFKEPLQKKGKSYDFAIIDGKQRLETMWDFFDGKIALPNDFEFFKDSKVQAGNMAYTELAQAYPDLKAQFDGLQLTVICIETEEIEMIEEMFSRLNEAAPLNAPEKRNAYGGPLPKAIRKLAEATFFKKSLPFPSKRYRHLDIATKFLYAEHEGKVMDTKKVYLDNFVKSFSKKSRTKMPSFLTSAQNIVDLMSNIFIKKDFLLRQIGIVNLYYHLFRIANKEGWVIEIKRKKLADFEELRTANRELAEEDISKANYDLLEFDRYVQAPNDAYAIRFRLGIMLKMVFHKKGETDTL